METTTFTQSNYSHNYNAFQLSLPLDLEIKINPDDEVVSFLKALEGVNLYKYLKRKERRGRKGYDNVMLLKVVLFARMIGECNLRNLESLCRHDIRFMYIMNEETPSFMTFERLLNDYLIHDIDDIYFEITNHICTLMGVDKSIQHIDGTKIFDEGSEIIYVNASIQEESALGRLMHDFQCSETREMHYEFLRKRVSYFKETEGGRREMCEIWEEIKQKGIIEGEARGEARGEMKGMVKSIQKLMIKKNYTLEEALNFFDIPEEERSAYIQRIIS